MQQIIKLVYKLLLLLFIITATNCGLTNYSPSEDESDEETLENIKKLNQEIEEYKSLESSVENKEATISSNHVIIKENEGYIKKKEEEVTADIKMAIESAGKKVPTKCIRCDWTSSMPEESFDKLADKYHRGGITKVKQLGGCEFWNSCPLCAKEKYNEYYKNGTKAKSEEIDRLKSDLDKERPLLYESRKYIKKTESSCKIICKQSARKHELKRERNQARELINKQAREIEALRNKTAEKEKETRLLKEERDRLEREKEEMKKKEEEREKAEASLKEEREKLEKEKIKRKKKKEKKKKKEHEKKLNEAKVLLENKLDITVIMSLTKLSREEIENLQKR